MECERLGKKKEKRISMKIRKSHGRKKEVGTKMGESCTRAEPITFFTSHFVALSSLLMQPYCTQLLFDHKHVFPGRIVLLTCSSKHV